MNITIFPTGTEGAESAVKYLLSDKDHEKKTRAVKPEILFGDPQTFTDIANATNRKHKYTSGVISFRDGAESASITPTQINALIDTFRSTFMAGLKPDENFSDFWVAHRDKGNLELHFLVANTELVSSQQLNIHPPGAKNIDFFNTFVSVMNDNFGFAQVVPDPLKIALKPFEAKTKHGKKDKKAKHDFAQVLHSEIALGNIKNRNQLIGFMKKSGLPISTIGSDFITVRLPGSTRNTRLKGPLFSKDSDYEALVKEHHQSQIPKFLTPAESVDQQRKLEQHIEARAAFNHRRYLGPPRPGARRGKHHQSSTEPFGTPTHPRTKDRAATEHEPEIRSQKQPQKKKDTPPGSTLKEQLADLKEEPSQAKSNKQEARDTNSASVGAGSALGGLEAQIGSLSNQYHNLKLLYASARGSKAQKLLAQIMEIEQKLAALNLELQKKKAQQKNSKDVLPT
ncbi:relaxase family protein [Ralstonia pseudosolanacearum]